MTNRTRNSSRLSLCSGQRYGIVGMNRKIFTRQRSGEHRSGHIFEPYVGRQMVQLELLCVPSVALAPCSSSHAAPAPQNTRCISGGAFDAILFQPLEETESNGDFMLQIRLIRNSILAGLMFVANAKIVADQSTSSIAPLPEAVASFGAAVSNDWLYVYGGHIGKAHSHSKENLSKSFRRIRMTGGEWEELPCPARLQGLAIVAHGGCIYRIGGMTAKNSIDEDPDPYSSREFARFDPKTQELDGIAEVAARTVVA